MDVVCQAKSGMGKTAVFVLATLQQIEPVDGEVSVLVLCHTRELAYQIRNEYARFTKYMPDVRTGVIYGGTPVAENQAMLKDKSKCPHIIVGTPGRMNALVRDKSLKVSGVKHFVIDECDKILEQVDMRRDVQDIFRATPHHKQVMMFSATLAKEVRPTCKKFMQNVSALQRPHSNNGPKVLCLGAELTVALPLSVVVLLSFSTCSRSRSTWTTRPS